MSVLVLVQGGADGRIGAAAFEAVGAGVNLAASLSTTFAVGLVGVEPNDAARLGSCGATTFFGVSGAEFEQARYATDAAAAEAIARKAGADIILAAGTSRMLRIAGGLAQRLGGIADTHVANVSTADGALSVTRWFYRQRIEGTVTRGERPWVIVLEPGALPAWSGQPAEVTVEAVAVPAVEARSRVTGVRSPSTGEQTVRPDADLLFVAGAGWTKKQADGQVHADRAQALILGFLRASQASLGGSKSLVDQSGEGQAVLSFMTHLNQVGQTGSSPRHRKGLATCCHGEEPHVIGWRFITERRVVNTNPNCGWVQGKADVVYVADAFAVMEKVNALLNA